MTRGIFSTNVMHSPLRLLVPNVMPSSEKLSRKPTAVYQRMRPTYLGVVHVVDGGVDPDPAEGRGQGAIVADRDPVAGTDTENLEQRAPILRSNS